MSSFSACRRSLKVMKEKNISSTEKCFCCCCGRNNSQFWAPSEQRCPGRRRQQSPGPCCGGPLWGQWCWQEDLRSSRCDQEGPWSQLAGPVPPCYCHPLTPRWIHTSCPESLSVKAKHWFQWQEHRDANVPPNATHIYRCHSHNSFYAFLMQKKANVNWNLNTIIMMNNWTNDAHEANGEVFAPKIIK